VSTDVIIYDKFDYHFKQDYSVFFVNYLTKDAINFI
jgi:hypothetical protein